MSRSLPAKESTSKTPETVGLRPDVEVEGRSPEWPAERISDTRKIETVILNGKILDRNSLRFDVKKDAGFRAVTGNFSSPMQ